MKVITVDPKTPITCGHCGGQGTGYAYPLPKGTMYCPTCSPAWLGAFLEWTVENHIRVAEDCKEAT